MGGQTLTSLTCPGKVVICGCSLWMLYIGRVCYCRMLRVGCLCVCVSLKQQTFVCSGLMKRGHVSVIYSLQQHFKNTQNNNIIEHISREEVAILTKLTN